MVRNIDFLGKVVYKKNITLLDSATGKATHMLETITVLTYSQPFQQSLLWAPLALRRYLGCPACPRQGSMEISCIIEEYIFAPWGSSKGFGHDQELVSVLEGQWVPTLGTGTDKEVSTNGIERLLNSLNNKNWCLALQGTRLTPCVVPHPRTVLLCASFRVILQSWKGSTHARG